MRVIQQYCEWAQQPPPDTLRIIERAGRTCYKSEDRITPASAAQFLRNILASGHESVIEHVSASMRFVTDRGVTHEMVRHRLASYSQESTRYCNYGKSEVTFIRPTWISGRVEEDICPACNDWHVAMEHAESAYIGLLKLGWTPQQARTVLPNSLKTEIVMTANLREWRHFFRLRTAKTAHPQMRDIAVKALVMFKAAVPILFDDINAD